VSSLAWLQNSKHDGDYNIDMILFNSLRILKDEVGNVMFAVNLSPGEQNGDRSACPVGFIKAEHLWQQGLTENRKQNRIQSI
jgi:hypothetical protein